MNGGHDLGGMHGLGPIAPEPEATEPVFHADWERRVFAMTLACGMLEKWNIDMSRHARERQHPADYLRHSYYENWHAGLETLLVETGLVSRSELASGRAEGPAGLSARTAAEAAAAITRGPPPRPNAAAGAKFAVGDRVRVVNRNPSGHTRAPRYARGRTGTIHRLHGVEPFADASAHGSRAAEYLYSVRFEARELWGDGADSRHANHIDLWEPHLEPAP